VNTVASKRANQILIGVTILLFGLGVGLIYAAATTPWHTDSNAYFAGLDAIRSRLYADQMAPDFDSASDAFHTLQNQYRTPKWLYADMGYAAVAWGALLLVMAFFRSGGNAGLTTRSGLLIGLAVLAGIGLLFVGFLASGLQPLGRQQVPAWSDSFGIVLFGAVIATMIILPVAMALGMSPLFLRRRQPAALFSLRGRGWLTSGVVSAIYLIPLMGTAVLLLSIVDAGGWATSTSGVLLGWVLLNARAVWLGHDLQTDA